MRVDLGGSGRGEGEEGEGRGEKAVQVLLRLWDLKERTRIMLLVPQSEPRSPTVKTVMYMPARARREGRGEPISDGSALAEGSEGKLTHVEAGTGGLEVDRARVSLRLGQGSAGGTGGEGRAGESDLEGALALDDGVGSCGRRERVSFGALGAALGCARTVDKGIHL